MSWLYRTLRRLKNQWVAGVAILLLLAASAFAFGLAGVLVLGLLGALFGMQTDTWEWVALSALVWLPLAVGVISTSLGRFSYKELERETAPLSESPYA
jgi:hypothetical protein